MADELIDWAEGFIRHADIHKRDILEILRKENRIMCKTKSRGNIEIIVKEELSEDMLRQSKEGWKTIVCLNTRKNLEFLLEKWDSLRQNPKLKIIFANPSLNLQWAVIPYTHDLISDRYSLKLGLKSIFSSVPECQAKNF